MYTKHLEHKVLIMLQSVLPSPEIQIQLNSKFIQQILLSVFHVSAIVLVAEHIKSNNIQGLLSQGAHSLGRRNRQVCNN